MKILKKLIIMVIFMISIFKAQADSEMSGGVSENPQIINESDKTLEFNQNIPTLEDDNQEDFQELNGNVQTLQDSKIEQQEEEGSLVQNIPTLSDDSKNFSDQDKLEDIQENQVDDFVNIDDVVVNKEDEVIKQSSEEEIEPNKFDNLVESNFNRSGYVTPLELNKVVDDDPSRLNTIGDKHLDTILDEFKQLDCGNQDKDNLTEQCQKLQDLKIFQLGFLESTPIMLFQWLDNNLYKPLGYKVSQGFTYPEIISGLFKLNKQNSQIHAEMAIPSENEFKQEMSQSYDDIESLSIDFSKNKDAISDIIMTMLKKMHVFWNVHRQRNDLKNIHSSILSLIREFLTRFKRANDSMKATTIDILYNIKNAYYKFIKAHKIMDVIRKRPAEMVTMEILRRYKNNVEKIHSGESSIELRVAEISQILDLLRAFYLINYYKDITDAKNQGLYEIFIVQKIKKIYEDYQKYLLEVGDHNFNEFKDFTATLLLKMEMRKYLIFEKYTIEEYSNLPTSVFQTQFSDATKIYYELQDALLVLPHVCQELTQQKLQDCTRRELTKILVDFKNRYQLPHSVSGSELMQYIKNGIDYIQQVGEDEDIYQSQSRFKNYYLSEVYSFTQGYKSSYQVREQPVMEKLEDELGYQIEKSKTVKLTFQSNYPIIDNLDRQLYDLFLQMKSKFNKYAPINKDKKVMLVISQTVQTLVDKFIGDNDLKSNKDLVNLQKRIQQVLQYWIKSHSIKYMINSHPLNIDNDFAYDIPAEQKDITHFQSYNQGMIQSQLMPDIGVQAGDIVNGRSDNQ